MARKLLLLAFASRYASFSSLSSQAPAEPNPTQAPCPECKAQACPEPDVCIVPEPDLEPNPCAGAPLTAELGNVPCDGRGVKVQSPVDVTPGFESGLREPDLPPHVDLKADGMCVVNVHWHLGAEHRSETEYSELFWFKHPKLPEGHRRALAKDYKEQDRYKTGIDIHDIPIEHVGHMCKIAKEGFERNDPIYTTEYNFKYCKDMHVGLTYEIHWPHSSLGACQTKWQFQQPFMDGVLCGATTGNVGRDDALEYIFNDRAVHIGVEGQVFTIVNTGKSPTESPYGYPEWDTLVGWHTILAGDDYATYKGSTTGAGADNEFCRATGGMVTWHQDRRCYPLEAATMDNLCRLMLVVPADDLSPDVEPHGARDTVLPDIADDPDDDDNEGTGNGFF